MSLGTTIRSLTRKAKLKFPGAADADLRSYIRVQVEAALDNPSSTTKDDDLFAFADLAFQEAAKNGEDWAVSLKNSVRDNVVKPIVQRADASGVDPVPAIVLDTNLSADEAQALVDDIRKADAAAAEAGLDEDLIEAEIDEGDEDEAAEAVSVGSNF